MPAAADAGANRFIVRVTDQTLLADDSTLNINVASTSDLVADFQLDGNTANYAAPNSGTTAGSPAYEPGMFDQALGFDGTDDFVTLPANIAGGLTDATFAARVRWDGGAAYQRIFDFGVAGGAQYLALIPTSNTGTLQFAILASGGTTQRLSGPSALPVGEWTHVAVTLIGTTGTLYVNGAAVATVSITVDPGAITQSACYLGKSQFAVDPLFNGTIDEFRIYNRGLSAAEVAALAVPVAATSVSDSQYTGWAAGYTFPGGQSGAAADADSDGLTNAWEYLTGTDPTLASSGTMPQPQVKTALELGLGNTGRTYLSIQARIRKRHLGASYVAEAATTPAGLAAADAATHVLQAGAAVPDGEFETITYYFTTALQDSPTGTGFIRLRSTIN